MTPQLFLFLKGEKNIYYNVLADIYHAENQVQHLRYVNLTLCNHTTNHDYVRTFPPWKCI